MIWPSLMVPACNPSRAGRWWQLCIRPDEHLFHKRFHQKKKRKTKKKEKEGERRRKKAKKKKTLDAKPSHEPWIKTWDGPIQHLKMMNQSRSFGAVSKYRSSRYNISNIVPCLEQVSCPIVHGLSQSILMFHRKLIEDRWKFLLGCTKSTACTAYPYLLG